MENQLNTVTPYEAVSHVKSGNRVFFQGAAMTPNVLIAALCERYHELKNVEIFTIFTPSPNSNLASFKIGANILQGPHQSAWKSTKTGLLSFIISLKLLFIILVF